MDPNRAALFDLPYYAVIFTSKKRFVGNDEAGNEYASTAHRMVELAQAQPGYLGHESARGSDGVGITVSYWRDLESIRAWKQNSEHLTAQKNGKASWYEYYDTRIAKVERHYSFG